MSVNVRKSTLVISRDVHKGKGQSVCQADIIVPDSMPDCLKVLQAEGKAVTESTIISSGKISVRGHVSCTILYVPENARGVKSMDYSMPFTYSENITDADETMFYETDCKVSHIEYQLVNSRKISVKAVVETDNRVVGKNEISYVCSVEGEEAQTKEKNIRALNRVVSKIADITVGDVFAAPQNATTVLKKSGRIKNKDVKVINNKIVAKGEIEFCVLYSDTEDRPEVFKNTFHFTEIIDAEGISDKQTAKINYRLQEISAKVQDGEGGRELKVEAVMKVIICSDETMEFAAISDIYGTDSRLVPKLVKIKVKEPDGESVARTEIREIVSLEGEAPQIAKIAEMEVKPYVNGCHPVKAGLKVEGEAECWFTYITDREDAYINTAHFNLPFSAIVETDCEKPEAWAEVESADFSLSGNNIELRIALKIGAESTGELETEVVTDITEQKEEDINRPAMVLYYVQKGDNIWEIAKRYHSKITDIEQVNKIDGESLKEGMMLLIPKK